MQVLVDQPDLSSQYRSALKAVVLKTRYVVAKDAHLALMRITDWTKDERRILRQMIIQSGSSQDDEYTFAQSFVNITDWTDKERDWLFEKIVAYANVKDLEYLIAEGNLPVNLLERAKAMIQIKRY